MKKSICIYTISTISYINQSIVSICSMKNNISDIYNITSIIFCVEDISKINRLKIQELFGIQILSLQSINNINLVKTLDKYKNHPDVLRWSNKPNCSLDLIEKYDVVFYIDNDIYFVNNCDFLIHKTNRGILLSPHHRNIVPSVKNKEFYFLLAHGFFNAGFIGSTILGQKALEWWSEATLWNSHKDIKGGVFFDQKYLDLLTIIFHDNVNTLDHKGCNIAVWNINNIDLDKIEPIFFHFSHMKMINNKKYNIFLDSHKKFTNEIQNINRVLEQ